MGTLYKRTDFFGYIGYIVSRFNKKTFLMKHLHILRLCIQQLVAPEYFLFLDMLQRKELFGNAEKESTGVSLVLRVTLKFQNNISLEQMNCRKLKFSTFSFLNSIFIPSKFYGKSRKI